GRELRVFLAQRAAGAREFLGLVEGRLLRGAQLVLRLREFLERGRGLQQLRGREATGRREQAELRGQRASAKGRAAHRGRGCDQRGRHLAEQRHERGETGRHLQRRVRGGQRED